MKSLDFRQYCRPCLIAKFAFRSLEVKNAEARQQALIHLIDLQIAPVQLAGSPGTMVAMHLGRQGIDIPLISMPVNISKKARRRFGQRTNTDP